MQTTVMKCIQKCSPTVEGKTVAACQLTIFE